MADKVKRAKPFLVAQLPAQPALPTDEAAWHLVATLERDSLCLPCAGMGRMKSPMTNQNNQKSAGNHQLTQAIAISATTCRTQKRHSVTTKDSHQNGASVSQVWQVTNRSKGFLSWATKKEVTQTVNSALIPSNEGQIFVVL